MKTKVCNACKNILPIEIFVFGKCRPCANKRRVEISFERKKKEPEYREKLNFHAQNWKLKNPRGYEQRRKEWLKSLYKMTPEDYDQLLKSQGGVCAICQQICKTKRGLSIDHNHLCCAGNRSCGKCIRGLLCSNCNRAIGMLQEDIAIFNRAIAYLTSPQK